MPNRSPKQHHSAVLTAPSALPPSLTEILVILDSNVHTQTPPSSRRSDVGTLIYNTGPQINRYVLPALTHTELPPRYKHRSSHSTINTPSLQTHTGLLNPCLDPVQRDGGKSQSSAAFSPRFPSTSLSLPQQSPPGLSSFLTLEEPSLAGKYTGVFLSIFGKMPAASLCSFPETLLTGQIQFKTGRSRVHAQADLRLGLAVGVGQGFLSTAPWPCPEPEGLH